MIEWGLCSHVCTPQMQKIETFIYLHIKASFFKTSFPFFFKLHFLAFPEEAALHERRRSSNICPPHGNNLLVFGVQNDHSNGLISLCSHGSTFDTRSCKTDKNTFLKKSFKNQIIGLQAAEAFLNVLGLDGQVWRPLYGWKKVFISTCQPHTQIFSTTKMLHICSNNIKRLAVTQGSLYRAKKRTRTLIG